MAKKMITIDGNQAAAYVAYALSDVAAIYPITPSSPMGEHSDAWSAEGVKNLFGETVDVVEMQSEAGAAGAVHGSLVAGALTTTFTAAQGLFLMLPDMHKIAGEMLPSVFHVSARSIAAQSLSIFGDHSDVMAARNTGYAMIASNGVQEAMDMALVSHSASLEGELPFLHFFDGFRTSHEVMKVEEIPYDVMRSMVKPEWIERFRDRAMRPEKPVIRVAAQNPDVYFQGRERSNSYYDQLPAIVQKHMDQLGAAVGRKYKLFDYVGDPNAKNVIIAMGSACDTIEQAVNYLINERGESVGLVKVRLYRPFSAEHLIDAIPATCEKIAVLDRTKEPGSLGEPLYLDVIGALVQKGRAQIKTIGGRYGLSSKEFTPSHVLAVLEHLKKDGHHNFTVGIEDDITKLSIPVTEHIDTTPAGTKSCMFWGLGSDGTVGANKNSIKIICDNTEQWGQGYFVYDSKKSYGVTVSHLRFGKEKVNMPYLITDADFVACHHPSYPGRYDILEPIKKDGIFLLNTVEDPSTVFVSLTLKDQKILQERNIKFYVIDALKIAKEVGLGIRINSVMQAVFFHLSEILPKEEAVKLIKSIIEKTYKNKGEDIVKMNWNAVDKAIEGLHEVSIPAQITKSAAVRNTLADVSDPFAANVIEPVARMKGDSLPVSAMSYDGTLPLGTSKLEKREMALDTPKWLPDNCIQCNQCVMACPHSVIRAKQIAPADLANKPENFVTVKSRSKNEEQLEYRLQVYTQDCTGCGVCIDVCPSKEKAIVFSDLKTEQASGQVDNFKFFDKLPNRSDGVKVNSVQEIGFRKPYFEFHGACAGCGETPYYRLMTQLFGNRMVVGNATGCSSIYGGTFPTIPFAKDAKGRGVSWGNSLFEDNAEYAFGMRLAVDKNRGQLQSVVERLIPQVAGSKLEGLLKDALANFKDTSEAAYDRQVEIKKLADEEIKAASGEKLADLRRLKELGDYFVNKSVWAVGGDGWAYDIGFGGLDHVLSMPHNVNILVLDTEVYSNTGGQASKSTPLASTAKFAHKGKRMGKKDLGVIAMSYGHVYVAAVSMGANRNQVINAFLEAEAHDGPSVIMAYSPCIAHGIDMSKTQSEQKLAVDTGYFSTYRYNPSNEPSKRMSWDCKPPTKEMAELLNNERRYTSLKKITPEEIGDLFKQAEQDAKRRRDILEKLSSFL